MHLIAPKLLTPSSDVPQSEASPSTANTATLVPSPPPPMSSPHPSAVAADPGLATPCIVQPPYAPPSPRPLCPGPSCTITSTSAPLFSLRVPTSASTTPALPTPSYASHLSTFRITMPPPPPPTRAPPTIPPATPADASPKRAPRAWTDAQLNVLCCLRAHSPLSYTDISIWMERLLGGPRIHFDRLRYKCNALRALLPPSEISRRRGGQPVAVDARWTFFASRSKRAVPVQLVLRACGQRCLWFGQAEEDALAVLLQRGELLDGEIARRLTRRFGCECSEEMVRYWYERNVGNEEGSWAWFEGKDASDVEVKRILRVFGL